MTVNLVKSKFAQAQVVFLGHVVCQSQVQPVKERWKQLIASSHSKVKQEQRPKGFVGSKKNKQKKKQQPQQLPIFRHVP